MEEQQSTKNLAGALLAAQMGIASVGKGSTNKFMNYRYTSADDMISAAREALHAAGLVARRVGWQMSPMEDGGQCVTMSMRLDHPASGENFTELVQFPAYTEKGRPMDKAVSGALTASMGYWLRDLLLLPRVDEVEDRDDRKYDPAKRNGTPRSDPTAIPGVSKGMPPPPDERLNAARSALFVAVGGWTGAANSDDASRAEEETNAACKAVLDALYGKATKAKPRTLDNYEGAALFVQGKVAAKASYTKWLESQTKQQPVYEPT